MMPRIKNSTKYIELGLEEKDYCVATFHRPSNVDDFRALNLLVDQLILLSNQVNVVFPVHPRTLKALKEINRYDQLRLSTTIIVLEPLGYIDFLNLVLHANYVLTDSGGIQEETAYLGIPCFTVRENTERPITLKFGLNELTRIDSIGNTYKRYKNLRRTAESIPFWDGKAAQRAVEHLTGFLHG
jgi:UDP-N-acetylglucosamine 2-epimerase (non-hydrolysing)